MTPEKLQEILSAHTAWLRGESAGARADLRGAVLTGADLTDAVLTDAVLTDADLRGADLRGAVLRGAVLTDADLRGADLTDADLRGAVLTGADLTGADLTDAVLRGAVLTDADLRGAVLRGAVLTGAVLTDAVLRGAVLTGGIEQFAVPGLHRRMLAAIEAEPGSLEMGSWHGAAACGTTHCRAGWAVMLAGPAGKALEWAVGTSTAGALIHYASCPWLERVPNFYSDNATALEDIRACAARDDREAPAARAARDGILQRGAAS